MSADRRSYLWALFTDEHTRELYVDAESSIEKAVAYLRMNTGRNPNNPEIARTSRELAEHDALFQQLWRERHVTNRSTGVQRMQHPIVGRIELTWMSLTLIDDSEQHIVVWIPEPGSPSAEALTVLSGLPADSAALDS